MKTFVAACVVVCGMAGSAWGETKEAAKQPSAGAKNITAGPKKVSARPEKITVDLGGGVKMEMTLIPAGEFMMGSEESGEATAAFFKKTYGEDYLKADWFTDEHPQHRVRITKPFYLGTYHVTRGQFRRFVAETHYKTEPEEALGGWVWNPKSPKNNKWERQDNNSWRSAGFEQTDEHPVVYVSWNDAVAFCEWLSKKEGKIYRLPTEAEWEYACRAGTTTRYYSGDDPKTLVKVGNVAGAPKAKFPGATYTIKAKDRYVFTASVGKFKPNAFGLYDMDGNAWQWCADWFGAEYYAASHGDDPTGPDSGDDPPSAHSPPLGPYRVRRGGSSAVGPFGARSAGRGGFGPGGSGSDLGFRVARTK